MAPRNLRSGRDGRGAGLGATAARAQRAAAAGAHRAAAGADLGPNGRPAPDRGSDGGPVGGSHPDPDRARHRRSVAALIVWLGRGIGRLGSAVGRGCAYPFRQLAGVWHGVRLRLRWFFRLKRVLGLRRTVRLVRFARRFENGAKGVLRREAEGLRRLGRTASAAGRRLVRRRRVH